MIIIACLLIFLCLFGLVKLLRKIMIGRIVHVLDRALSRSVVVTMSLGVLITVAVQSSSDHSWSEYWNYGNCATGIALWDAGWIDNCTCSSFI